LLKLRRTQGERLLTEDGLTRGESCRGDGAVLAVAGGDDDCVDRVVGGDLLGGGCHALETQSTRDVGRREGPARGDGGGLGAAGAERRKQGAAGERARADQADAYGAGDLPAGDGRRRQRLRRGLVVLEDDAEWSSPTLAAGKSCIGRLRLVDREPVR